jgi:hypothetical protein
MKSNFTFSLLLCVGACLCFTSAGAQNIYTFAGNGAGTAGYSGDGGNASAALLYSPSCVATHDYEDVYIADQGNHVIRKVNASGAITTYAGKGAAGNSGNNGPADSCELNDPFSVALDGSGNLYIADYLSNVIRKVNVSTGVITTVAGTGTAGYTGDGGAATNATLFYPYGVAVDGYGDLFIADAGNNVIREVTLSGYIQTVVGNGTGAGLSLGDGGYTGDGGPAYSAELNFPTGIAVDIYGNKFIADAANNAIRKVSTTDTITTLAGVGMAGYSGDGGYAADAAINFATGVAVDASGNVYIADQGNNAVRKVNTSGKISTIAGNGTAGYGGDAGPAVNAQLSAPKGVAVDGSGLIYIADAGNNAVRIIGNYTVNAVKSVAAVSAAMEVYPNPATSSFNILLPLTAATAYVTVTDMLGRELVSRSIDGVQAQNTPITINDLPAGNYVVKASIGTNTYRQQVVVLGQN